MDSIEEFGKNYFWENISLTNEKEVELLRLVTSSVI